MVTRVLISGDLDRDNVKEEEEVAVMCRAMTQHDQIANLVHEIKKFQISNTVTDTSDQHANEIQALTTRIEKRKGASM